MVKNPAILRAFEDEFLRNEKKRSYEDSLKLYTMMWEEAAERNGFPPERAWEGIETDIRIARVLNRCLTKSSPE